MNIENFNAVLAFIEAHPARWNQSHWCGTSCCFAGHAQLLSGKPAMITTVERDAIEWLNISKLEAVYLFSVSRTLDDFRSFREMLDSERFNMCVEYRPELALEYASERLTSDELEVCAQRIPWAALKYASKLLTPEQLDMCAQRAPLDALNYAYHLLTPERRKWCYEKT